ncbi:MAG: hypothetical protein CM1200mP3_16550 [Chloroflexota bacterium]|nr:MAG: hypothetical protein CM1200mP3_16550 [Chloroflexota bacterium]
MEEKDGETEAFFVCEGRCSSSLDFDEEEGQIVANEILESGGTLILSCTLRESLGKLVRYGMKWIVGCIFNKLVQQALQGPVVFRMVVQNYGC